MKSKIINLRLENQPLTCVPVAQLPFKKPNHKKTKAQAFDKAD
jgi:hypothetical protein